MPKLFFIIVASVYLSSSLLLKGATFAFTVWMAKVLDVSVFADWGVLYSLQTAFIAICSAGVVEAVVGLLKDTGAASKKSLFSASFSTFFLNATVSMILFLIVWLFFFRTTSLTLVAFVGMLVTSVLLSFAAFFSRLIRLDERHLSSLLYSFVVPFSALAGSLLGFLLYRNLEAIFLGSAFSSSCALLLARAEAIPLFLAKKDVMLSRAVQRRMPPFIVVVFLGWLSGYGTVLLVGYGFEKLEVARFTFMLSISAILQLVTAALNQVWSPRFYMSVSKGDLVLLEERNYLIFGCMGALLGAIGLSIIFCYPLIITQIGGNLTQYSDMQLELFFMLSGYVLLIPWWNCQNYYLAFNKGAELMQIVIGSSMLGISVWVFLMWQYGAVGIYIGFMIQMLIRTVSILYAARKNWQIRSNWIGVTIGVVLCFCGILLHNLESTFVATLVN